MTEKEFMVKKQMSYRERVKSKKALDWGVFKKILRKVVRKLEADRI